MTLVLSLILIPFIAGISLLFLRTEPLRKTIVGAVVLAVSCGVVALAGGRGSLESATLPFSQHAINTGMLAVSIAMSVFILYVGGRAKNWLVIALTLAQAGLMTWFELTAGTHVEVSRNLVVDKFAVIMALINGLVGGGICLYALGYMREYHGSAHSDVPDRRPLFFAWMFVFMGGMFGLIFANNLTWLFLFWEITTLCSFLLIGYTQTAEAKRNAMRALVMNLAGGLAFAVGIVWFQKQSGSVEMDALIQSKHTVALLPAALLCFAGITKSAQLPFSSWLLGAMLAPTPVSALLHSSTMVKAGVYLILRMAPVVTGTKVGFIVALVGAITFLVTSLAAITASDAKRVLAYSTIANLGLIVLCGGVGTAAAVWAGVLLIIFHAVAKCLLFLCVGMVEHRLHSRDIESMCGLIVTLPRLAFMMLIGMAGMFLAPFGMLISKWAVLKAVVDAYPVLSVFIVFGSAATLFFWVKWMGKLLEVIGPPTEKKVLFQTGQAIALYGLSITTFLTCLLFPLVSKGMIEPYVVAIFGPTVFMSQGNIVIMIIMMAVVILFPFAFLWHGHARVTDAYLGGANAHSSVQFVGSANQLQTVATGNYYLSSFFSESWLNRWGVVSCALLLAAMIALAIIL